MTLEELEQYRCISAEANALNEQIRAMYNTYSSPSFESTGTFNAESHSPVESALNKIQKLETIYNAKINDLIAKSSEIEKWLGTVQDANVRAAIRYHYLLSYTWKETSKRVYGYRNSNYYNARKAVFRYFGKE